MCPLQTVALWLFSANEFPNLFSSFHVKNLMTLKITLSKFNVQDNDVYTSPTRFRMSEVNIERRIFLSNLPAI